MRLPSIPDAAASICRWKCRLASDWTVIFGPSGSGKSTLLRLLAGLDRAARNQGHRRILLDGIPLTDSGQRLQLKPGRRHTALVAQQPALFPHLSVTANVALWIGWS